MECLQKGQLRRPDHADLRFKCRTYARMIQHMKVLNYFQSLKVVSNVCFYEFELKVVREAVKANTRAFFSDFNALVEDNY
jgi:hypothetical protein